MNDIRPLPTILQENHFTDRQNSRIADGVRMGLSLYEQVVCLDIAEISTRKRLNTMRRMVIAGATAHTEELQRTRTRYRAAMITLTYRPGEVWEPHDISHLIDHYRRWLNARREPLRAVWVLELQKRGAPHYHLLIWMRRGLTPPLPDKQGWWKKGCTQAAWARRAIGYLAKYSSKGNKDGATVPKGARLFGIFGCHTRLDWWRAPAWARAIGRQKERIHRGKNGWWLFDAIALAFRSPWKVVRASRGVLEIVWQGWQPTAIIPMYLYNHSTSKGELR